MSSFFFIIFNVTNPTSRNRFGIGTQTNILLNRLHEWCEAEFDQAFVKPLETFCLTHDNDGEKRLTREKRVIAAAIIVTSLVVSVIATIGVAAYSSSQAIRNDIATLEEQQDLILRQLETNKMLNDHVKDILMQLDKRTDVLSKAFTDANERFASLMNFHVPSVTTVSKIGTLAVVKERFFAIGVDWKKKILNPLFLDILNITLPCADDCPSQLMTPISCYVDDLRKQIKLSFEQKTIKTRTQVLVADPFRLITNITADSICFGSYRGPHSVIYDEKNDCVTSLRGDADSNENMILSPAVAYCSDAVRINESAHYWSRVECIPRPLIREDDIIQLKSSDQYTYIYCATLKISVFNRTFDCPNFVFSIPHFASFSIGKLDYRADNLQLSHSLKLAPVTSSRVNFHLLPTLPAFENDEKLAQEITSMQTGMLLPEKHILFRHLEDHTLTYALLLLLFLISILIVWRKIYPSSRSLRNPRSKFGPHSERVALSDIEGNQSDDEEGQETKKPKRATSPKIGGKSSALVCALSLLMCMVVSHACPEIISMEIDVSICRYINSSQKAACEATQFQIIDRPLLTTCKGPVSQISRVRKTRSPQDSARHPLFAVMRDVRTIMSVIPLLEMEISDILNDMSEKSLHHSLLRISDSILPDECSSLTFTPLTCRFDNETKTLSVTAYNSVHLTSLTSSVTQFINRFSTLLTLLSNTFTGFSIAYVLRLQRNRRHSHLTSWKSEDELPPPQPLRNIRNHSS